MYRRSVLVLLVLLVGLACAPASTGAGTAPNPAAITTIERRDVEVAGARMTYGLIMPSRVDQVLLVLPPGAQDWDMVVAALNQWAPELQAEGWLVLAPATRGVPFYEPEGAASIVPFLDAAGREFGIDVARVHLFGMSFGGISALRVASNAPERFHNVVVMPGLLPDDEPSMIAALKTVPVTMVVGDKDRGWRRGSQKAAARMREAGVDIELVIVPGQRHLVHRAYDWPALRPLLLHE